MVIIQSLLQCRKTRCFADARMQIWSFQDNLWNYTTWIVLQMCLKIQPYFYNCVNHEYYKIPALFLVFFFAYCIFIYLEEILYGFRQEVFFINVVCENCRQVIVSLNQPNATYHITRTIQGKYCIGYFNEIVQQN